MVSSWQSECRTVVRSPDLRVPGWSSTGAAQDPLPDDWWVEMRVGLAYYRLFYSYSYQAYMYIYVCVLYNPLWEYKLGR